MSSITDLKIRTLRYRTEAIGKHLQGKHDQKSHGRGGTSEGGGSGDGGGEMLSSSGGGQSNFEMALAASGITSALDPDSSVAAQLAGVDADERIDPSLETAEMAFAQASTGEQVYELMMADPPEGLGDMGRATALSARAVEMVEYLDKAPKSEDVYGTFDDNGDQVGWTEERTAQHDDLLEQIWAENAGVPTDGIAIVTGGLGGAGKTSLLEGGGLVPSLKDAEAGRGDYVVLNPDLMKEKMVEAGMADEFAKNGASPSEVAFLIHEESSYLTKRLADQAYGANKNVIWDITMNPTKSKYKTDPITGEKKKSEGEEKFRNDEQSTFDKLTDLTSQGYQIHGVFADIPAAKSAARAVHRWRRGVEKWFSGKGGTGGRWVPPFVIMENKTSGKYQSRNAESFAKAADAGLFTTWSWYNTDVAYGEPPILVDSDGTPDYLP